MAIFFVVGKPGGGKTYYGVKQMVDELGMSDRFIVGNIGLNLPELRQLCHDESNPEFNFNDAGQETSPPVDLDGRIRVLDENEAAQFWLYEPGRDFIQRRKIQQGQRTIDVPDFEDRAKRGCLYIIDEVHVLFGAREWQNTGPDCTFFLSQHRKLRCDIILITQHPDQVDKALRRLAQDYIQMRNLSREPIFGFRIGSIFRWSRSMNSPTGSNARVFESGFLKLDVTRYGKVYDTMQGIGIQGRVSPTIEKKGRSLWWLTIPIAALILAVIFGPSLMEKFGQYGMKRLVTGVISKFGHGKSVVVNVPTNQPPVNLVGAPNVKTLVTNGGSSRHRGMTNNLQEIYVTGWYQWQRVWTVFLSDGRTVTSQDEKLTSITPQGVVYDGKFYHRSFYQQIPRAPSLPSPSIFVAPRPVDKPSALTMRQDVRVHDSASGETLHSQHWPSVGHVVDSE